MDDELRPEYDLSQLLKNGVRGKYAEQYQASTNFVSLDELVKFLDTHDMGEHEEDLPEAQFDLNLQSRTHLVVIDEEISSKLTEIAEQEQTPVEALVNSWLREKISSYREKA